MLNMSDEAMTPKERWLAVLEGRETDRVPMDYWGTDEVTEMLIRHTGSGSLVEMFGALKIDGVLGVESEYIDPLSPMTRTSLAAGTGTCTTGRVSTESASIIPWPNTGPWRR